MGFFVGFFKRVQSVKLSLNEIYSNLYPLFLTFWV